MQKKFLDILSLMVGFVILDGLLCLPYFWGALLCYTLWFPYQPITFFAAVRSVEISWHRPGLLVLSLIGVLSPLIAFLPLTLALPFHRKLPSWIKVILGFIWLGEIFALGFFAPRF